MDIIERLDRLAVTTVDRWAATYVHLWISACRHDGIAPNAPAVLFSATNPYVPFLERTAAAYQEARRNQKVSGYVGLALDHGRAILPASMHPRTRQGAHHG